MSIKELYCIADIESCGCNYESFLLTLQFFFKKILIRMLQLKSLRQHFSSCILLSFSFGSDCCLCLFFHRLESFFRPVSNTSAPIKRKEVPENTPKETRAKKSRPSGGKKKK
uniref:Flap endonuclease 1 n=1 Tax=Rhizophora mucronata TaxID=61149 RepID=A0A2P2JYG9_RHIMU